MQGGIERELVALLARQLSTAAARGVIVVKRAVAKQHIGVVLVEEAEPVAGEPERLLGEVRGNAKAADIALDDKVPV